MVAVNLHYLTIIPRAQMGSESIAHEAQGRMGYWLRGHEGERNNCFSKIHLVGHTLQAVVSPGPTLRYEGRETTASIRLLLWSSRRLALWTNKLTVNM